MARFQTFNIFFYIFLLPFVVPNDNENDFRLLLDNIQDYIQTAIPTTTLLNLMQEFQLTHLFRQGIDTITHTSICLLCNTIFSLYILKRRNGMSRDSLATETKFFCTHLGIEDERVCSGLIDLNIDVLIYIVDNNANVTSSRICGVVFQGFGCAKEDTFDWSVDLPEGLSPKRSKASSTSSFQILQISDIHYDPDYTPGGNADCGEPVCCQKDQGEPKSTQEACGYWSDYRDADVPWHLIEDATKQVKSHHFDYVYYTGDVISHRVWDTSVANNTIAISRLYSHFKDNLTVPVFPIFGNHEPHPLNLWPSDNLTDDKFSVRWLLELAADSWSQLVGEDIRETVLKGGYYTVSPRPGFRIIAINSNVCYVYNWWLIFEDQDPYSQLQWLADTLKQAEDDEESVHILSHVPAGTKDCLSVWGREYSRIVDRFASTITGQFNGHSHLDEFYVYYNRSESTQPVGVAFNGASLTPYSDSNPSYKLYDVDASSFVLKDYEEWTFNLTLANSQASESPKWYKLYSFGEAYGADSLEPVEVDKVLHKMAENHSVLDDYFKFKYRNGDTGIAKGCNERCRRDNLCQMATSVFGEDVHCNRFLKLYNQK